MRLVMTNKTLGRKAYGSIGHLPNSRVGPKDHHVHEGQARICTVKARDKHDRVIVQEKLDGSCTLWRWSMARSSLLDGQAGPPRHRPTKCISYSPSGSRGRKSGFGPYSVREKDWSENGWLKLTGPGTGCPTNPGSAST